MPTFELQYQGKTYEVDAPDQQTAVGALGKISPQAAPAIGGETAYDSTPFKYNPRFGGLYPNVPGAPGYVKGMEGRQIDATPQPLKTAAANGVDIDTGAPAGIAKASFADTPQNAQAVYQTSLDKFYGKETPTRIGPDSGQVEFLNPKTNRWTLAEGSTLASRLPTAASGSLKAIPTIAGGLAGATAGAFVGGPGGAAAGSVVGSSAGGAAGQFLHNVVGRAIGAIPNDEDHPLSQDVGREAFTSGAWDAAGLVALGAIPKYAKYVTTGKQPFTGTEAQALLAEQRRQSKIVSEITRGSGTEFAPDAAQIANTPGSGISSTEVAARAAAGRQYAENAENVRSSFAALQTKNWQAIQNYFENKINQFRLQGLNNPKATAEVAQALSDPYNTLKGMAQQEVAKLPQGVSEAQTAEITRGALSAARTEFKNSIEDPAWDAYRKATGLDPLTSTSNISMPWSQDVRNLMTSWSSQEKNALLGLAKQDTAGLKLSIGGEPSEDDIELFKSLGHEPPPQGVDLASVDNAIQWIRQNARRGLANQQGVVLPTKKLNDLEGALTDMRNSYLAQNRPDIKNLLDAAEGASALKADKFRNGLVDTMLTHDGTGQLRLTDGEALNRLMSSNDEGQINEVLNLIKSDPAAKDQLNQFLLAKYRSEVMNDAGTPTVAGHNKFMKNYGVFVKNSFTPDQAANLDKIGGLAQAVKNEYTNLRTIMPRMVTDSTGTAESLNSNQLVTNLFSSRGSVETLDRALQTIGKYPYKDFALEQWRASAADALYNRVVKDGVFDPKAVTQLVQGNNGQNLEVLSRLFGTQGPGQAGMFKKAMQNLQEAQTILARRNLSGKEPDQMNIFQKGARAYFGPFAEEGRMLTFLKQLRGLNNPQKIYKALTDPDTLREYVGQSAKTISQIKKLTAVTDTTQSLDRDFK